MSDKAVRAAGKLQQRIEELEAEVLHENDLFLTQRNKTEELEAQLVEANERAEKAAQDGWLKTAETQLARAKKAEAQLEAVNDALRDCNYTDCGCCNAVRAALNGDDDGS